MRLLREKCRELFFQSQLIYNFIIRSSLGRSERELEQRPKNVMRVPLRGSRVGHFVRFDRFGHCGHIDQFDCFFFSGHFGLGGFGFFTINEFFLALIYFFRSSPFPSMFGIILAKSYFNYLNYSLRLADE